MLWSLGAGLLSCLATSADRDEVIEHLKDIDADTYQSLQYGGDDCDDRDASVHPGASEEPYNDVDDDCDPTTLDRDLDQDGFDVPQDCDDSDPSVYPGAPEVWYDGVNQDCDDEDQDFDQDGDGYDLDQDCDDEDPTAAPGEVEQCDLVDNDCDEDVDEGVNTWFPDDDSDGWGVSEGRIQTCTPPSGHVLLEGDCDDARDDVNPSAEEVCNDLADNDCDGSYTPCGWASTMGLDGADVTLVGSEGADRFGWVVDGGIDLTGDAVADLIVAAPDLSEGGTANGAVFVLPGPVSASTSLADAVAVIRGDPGGGSIELGHDLVVVSGGGIAPSELLVVTAGGQAAAFRSPLAGALTSADAHTIYLDGVQEFANDLFDAGDVNGDRVTDFLLGHSAAEAGAGAEQGAVRLFLRDEDGEVDADAPAATWFGVATGDRLGEDGGAADVNGDGYDDVLLGAAGADDAFEDAGAVYLFLGPQPGSDLGDADGIRLGEAPGDASGVALGPAGDLDGDGLEDVLIGAAYSDRGASNGGALFVVTDFGFRAEASVSTADTVVTSDVADGLFGFATAGNIDLDGDGSVDLAVSVPGDDATDDDVGGACVFLTPPAGVVGLDTCDVRITGSEAGGLAGVGLFGGDLNGDGLDDLALGVTHAYEGDAAPPGAVAIFLGSGY